MQKFKLNAYLSVEDRPNKMNYELPWFVNVEENTIIYVHIIRVLEY